MSKLKLYDMNGASAGDYEVRDDLLVHDKGSQAVRDVVAAHLARRRRGTASTLRKGEVAGSNKKPWQQKGTGRARAGYRQSPVWRGGAVAFGPHYRSYERRVNRNTARLAFRRAFSERVRAGEVRVLEELVLPEARTKSFAALLKSLNVSGPALFIDEKIDRSVAIASRNVPGVEVVRAEDVNVYQLMRYPAIVVSKSGMEKITARLMARAGGRNERAELDYKGSTNH